MPRKRVLDDAVVLERALPVFWRRGYAATSMRDLGLATGLGPAALYNRFSDKDGIFLAVLHRYAQEGMADRIARFSALDDPLAAILGFLTELVDLSMNDPERRGCMLVNTALDGAALPAAATEFVRQGFEEIEVFFRRQLERARDGRRVGPQVDPARAAESLVNAMLAIRVLARLEPDRQRLGRIVDGALAPLVCLEALPQ